MQYILGAYSQLPFGSTKEELETMVARQLKPLLTMVYRNSDLKLLFRLSITEFDYLEMYHPELNMLINDLCRKGQLEILSSSYYDVVLSLIPSHERASQIEKTTTYIRKHFSKKPKGLWFYNQVFNPPAVPLVGLSSLEYMVISTYNQVSGIEESSKPFYTEEMGKAALVFPTDDRISKLTSDLYRKNLTLDKYLNECADYAKTVNSAISTIMLNMDQLMGTEGSVEVFNVLYRNLGNKSTLPSVFLQDNEISRTHYLPNGIYGRDFSIGKATSINQFIYDNPVLARNYGLVNLLREVLRDNKKVIEDRKNLENLLMKASSSSLYFPGECENPAIRRAVNRFACEIESILACMDASPIPEETDIDFDRTEEFPIIGKTNISYLNRRGAVLSRFVVSHNLADLALHSGEGLFCDSFINERGKETKLFVKNYEVTPLEKKRSDFFASLPVSLGKVQINLNKRFKFRQNTVIVEIEIENLSNEKLTDFTYVNTINLALPQSFSVTCPEGEIQDTQAAFTQSVMLQDKGYPFSISVVLGEEATIQRTDFFQKSRSWLGDRTYYEYTQLKIQKKLSLEPFEDTRLTIGFRTEKRKEKHNDTTEQSTS
ncbi:MAG: hypothetical protein IKP61_04100 [Spirochaetales bacterium]|nr:hypothetical protein [Spirochaetales bacterium]